MKVLVTGAAGFIGSNLVRYLLKEGCKVTGLDSMDVGSNIRSASPLTIREQNYSFVNADLRNERAVLDGLRGFSFDAVVHLAAQSHVDRSLINDDSFWETQVIGTRNLFKGCNIFLRPGGRFINQITDEAYGEIPPHNPPAVEGQPFNPNPPYACSKVAQYYVGKSFEKNSDIKVISTFPVNNFGPFQYEEKLIPKFTKLLLAGKQVPLMASTHFERDWLAVSDMCRALALLLTDGIGGEDYNIGAFNHKTNLDLTHHLLELTGRDESAIKIVPDRKSHDCRYAVNYSKISELGWAPQENFEDYLAKTVEWYKENE